MLQIARVFLFFLLSFSHYITCGELDDNRKQWLARLSWRMGSCSDHFQYLRTDDFINGKLTLPHMEKGDKVKITFKKTSSEYPKFGGIFLPEGSAQEIIKRLQEHIPIIYRVDFPVSRNVPELFKIFVNDNEICKTLFFDESITDILVLQSTLNIVNESLPVFTYNIHIPYFGEKFRNETCGLFDTDVTIPGFTPLAYGGTIINRGEFPWLTAIYKKQRSGISFICGGSLLTSKIILSAAHCFLGLSLTPEKITAMLGRYNLTNLLEDGYTVLEIKAISLHPDYKHGLGFSDADLALLETKEHISFTKFIKPICLWSEPADESRIVNQMGVVVGWGSDEDGNSISIAPKKVNIKIVSEKQCLRSSTAFNAITSSRTLCAGNRDGSGPCEGDSGGGLMLNRNGVWMLRGVISLALIVQHRCDLQQYAVYCDVAKHMPWLLDQIEQKKTELTGSIDEICGISGAQSRTEHPWLAAIYSKSLTGLLYECTGTLVSSRSVLAPANCFSKSNLAQLLPHFVRIYLGRYDLNNIAENGVVSRDVAALIFHPAFKPSVARIEDNNIVILQMQDPVSFSQYVKPICLWRESADQTQIVGESVTLSSWERSKIRDEISTVPTSVEVNISSLEDCQLLGYMKSYSSQRTFCLTRFGNNCEGMLMLKRNERWFLRGVSSWSYNHQKDDFCVFGDIAEFYSNIWILSNILS